MFFLKFSNPINAQIIDHDITEGIELYNSNNFEKSIKVFKYLLEEFKKNEDEFNEELVICNYYIGSGLKQISEYLSSEYFLLESLKRANKLSKNSDKIRIVILLDLSEVYENINKYDIAEKYYLEAIAIENKDILSNAGNYSVTLSKLSKIYKKTGRYVEAETLIKEAIDFNFAIKGKNTNDYCVNLSELGDLYAEIGKYLDAKKLYLDAIEILNQLNDVDEELYLTVINNYSLILVQIGDYDKAEKLLFDNVEKRKLSKNIGEYIISLNNLTYFYQSIGNYTKSEFYLKEALTTLENNNLTNTPIYISTMQNYGSFLINQKDYLHAENIYLNLKNLFQNKYSNTYLNINNNLFVVSGFLGKKEISKKLINESEAIADSILNNNSIEKAELYYSVSSFYFATKDYEKELNYLKKAAEIYKNVFGFNSSGYLSVLDKIGEINYKKGDIKKSDSIYSFINGELKNIKIIRDDKYDFLIGNTSFYYYIRKQYDKSIKLIVPHIKYFNNKIKKEVILRTLKKNENLNSENQFHYDFFNNLLNKNTSSYYLLEQSYNNEILVKGLALRNYELFKKAIINSEDQQLSYSFLNLVAIHSKLNTMYTSSFIDENKIKQNEILADSLEKEIISKSTLYKKYNSEIEITWSDIRNTLKNDECAIEILKFNYCDDNWKDSTLYAALILRHEFKAPKFIYLFEEKILESLVQKHLISSDSSFLNQLYGYADNGKNLQELIWAPIDTLLKGIKTIYIAPSGIFNTINLAALPLNNSIRLGDRYKIRFVGSTGDILSLKEQYISNSSIKKAWLFGGVDYDKISFTLPKFIAKNEFNPSLYSNQITRSGIEKWNYLQNTFYEASSIDTMLKNNKITTLFINGKLASKTALKNISGESNPYILHIATHGYFFPNIKKQTEDLTFTKLSSKQDVLKMSDNPMLRSGLIFAGANKTWSMPNNENDSTDDGILTAFEISNLDLGQAKLVVMSACETGLGDINGSEGVFGLQRAFKLAGANNIIMSLWKVPDAQTKELMKMFYQNCFKGLSISDALRTAQTEMSKKYSPYYWAAFKLLE